MCVYKCGSNEVVSSVTTFAALRGSLIYHSSAATSILFIASVAGLYQEVVLEIVSPEVGALLGLWQGQMGSVMGHSHHRRPPPVEIVWRNKVEDAPPQNCFDLGLGSYLTPNCGSFPIPSPCTQIIP